MQNNIFLLTSSLLLCHFLADYTHLSRPWMLKAKSKGKPVFPIFCHAMVHTILMGIVLYFWKYPTNNYVFVDVDGIVRHLPCDIKYYKINTDLLCKALFIQLFSHTLIDVTKGYLNRLNIFKDITKPYFWILHGIDQLLHQLVILYMIYLVTQ